MFPKTKTEIAKKALHIVVAANAEAQIENQIVQRTDLTEDDIVVKVASFAGGHLVAIQADPYTDRLVDAIVGKYQSWRASKHAKQQES